MLSTTKKYRHLPNRQELLGDGISLYAYIVIQSPQPLTSIITVRKDTTEKSAERFFAAKRQRLGFERADRKLARKRKAIRRQKGVLRLLAAERKKQIKENQTVLYTFNEKRILKTALKNLSQSLSYAAALVVTEDNNWRAKYRTKTYLRN